MCMYMKIRLLYQKAFDRRCSDCFYKLPIGALFDGSVFNSAVDRSARDELDMYTSVKVDFRSGESVILGLVKV